MDDQFCHKPDCHARGLLRLGNIRLRSRKQRRDSGDPHELLLVAQ
jgi:hypothetical protein